MRFGRSDLRHLNRMAPKIFRPLLYKSRDELEQYFITQEKLLKPHEKAVYISVIFNLSCFSPDADSERPLQLQMDTFFLKQLCRLNADELFWAGMSMVSGLRNYLVRYAIMYFDFEQPSPSPWRTYAEDFINRHRTYHPPRTVQRKLEEAGRLFGVSWSRLKGMDRTSLSRLYRQLALKFHPDQGGDPDAFRRLTHYYQILLRNKPRR